jgi:hypothetical protein
MASLGGAWKDFWQGGAKQFVLDGLHMIGQGIRTSICVLEDALLFVLGILSGRWDKAWGAIKDMVSTTLDSIGNVLKTRSAAASFSIA